MLTEEGAEVFLSMRDGQAAESTRLQKQLQELRDNQSKLRARIAAAPYAKVPRDVQVKDSQRVS